jgi:hypothetical protein
MQRYSWYWLPVVALVACAGEKPATTTEDDDDDTQAGDDDDVTPGDDDDDTQDSDTEDTTQGNTGDSGGGGGEPNMIDPVAVGFEFDGVVRGNGSLEGYVVTGYGQVPPVMVLTFASLDYFYATTVEQQDREYCIAFGEFQPPPLVKPNQIPTWDATFLFSSYEVALGIEFHNCTGADNNFDYVIDAIADPAIWGSNAENLVDPFVGAHFGYGWGPMTDYLRDAWTQTTIDDIGNSMAGTYIAINDAQGTWEAFDWTTGILFEWDETTGELVDDGMGFLVGIDISGVQEGDNLPDGYMRSFAYWYQDFVLMDFTNLQDGAP